MLSLMFFAALVAMTLQWRCEKCAEKNWLHYEHCVSCGLPRPAPPQKPPTDNPITEPPQS